MPRSPERAAAARLDALSVEHFMTHFPKNPLCDICNLARLYSKRIRAHRIADPEEDIEEPEKFGEQIACDHCDRLQVINQRQRICCVHRS